jgi:hypothetical protein
VHWAPGIPRALFSNRAKRFLVRLGRGLRGEIATCCLKMCCLKAGAVERRAVLKVESARKKQGHDCSGKPRSDRAQKFSVEDLVALTRVVIPGRLEEANSDVQCTSENLEILRCAIAHHSSRFAWPGMTARGVYRHQQFPYMMRRNSRPYPRQENSLGPDRLCQRFLRAP